jgi:hypothetical protein
MQVITRSRRDAGPQQVNTSEGRYQNELVQIFNLYHQLGSYLYWFLGQDVQPCYCTTSMPA